MTEPKTTPADENIDKEVDRLGIADKTLFAMTSPERHRALKYLKDKYQKEWPSNGEY